MPRKLRHARRVGYGPSERSFDEHARMRVKPSCNSGLFLKPRAGRGFTLIELLTVLAVIGVLATLLAAALSSSKRKARQVASVSNLRQISLGVNLYLDDERRRPQSFADLVLAQYLPNTNVLKCLEDKLGNWGGKVQPASWSGALQPSPRPPASYLHSFFLDDRSWNTFLKKPAAFGLAVCQLHGLGTQDANAPSIYNFEGLIWRAQIDGAVVRRQVFWNFFERNFTGPDAVFAPGAPADSEQNGADPALQLFLDPP